MMLNFLHRIIDFDSEKKSHKLKYLDGLRGVAALMVVLNHYTNSFYPALFFGKLNEVHISGGIDALISGTPLNVVYGGDFAVSIFFILSGYVLTYKFFKYHNREIIVSSAARRYPRLLIPVLFSIIIAYSIMSLSLFYNRQAAILTLSNDWLSELWNFNPNFITMLKQAFFGVFFTTPQNYYNPVTWTMTYEFFGSFLVFGFAYFFGNLKIRYNLYILAMLLLFKTYFFAFILGLILSDLYNSEVNYGKKIDTKIINILFLAIGIFLVSYPSGKDVSIIYMFMKSNFIGAAAFYHTAGLSFIFVAILNSNELKLFHFLDNLYKIRYRELDTKNIILFLAIGLFLGSYPTGRQLNNTVNGTIYSFMNVNFLGDTAAFYHMIGAFLIFITLLNSNKLRTILSSKITYFLGKISFSMYLIHLIIIGSFSSFLFLKLIHYFTYGVAFVGMFIISLILILISSYYISTFVDTKGMEISYIIYEKIKNKLNGKKMTNEIKNLSFK